MLWNQGGGGGAGVVAKTCTSGDFFSAVDGSGNFTCATPAGSGDVTAVGDCASGDCFTASSNNSSLIFEGSTADSSETTLTVTDPTADRTITLPNRTGKVALERWFDVRDYGAVCDASTDDATAIQSAITAACADGPGGTIYVPAKTCKYGTTLTGCSGLAIIGSESTERASYATTQPHELMYSGTGTGLDLSSKAGVRIAGVRLSASNASFSTGTVLKLDSGSYFYLDRVALVAPNLSDTATSKLISANDVVGLWIKGSLFDRGGYHIYGRTLSSNYTNVVSIKDTVFYRSEVCSIQNAGDTWDVSGSWWQQQGASSTKSTHWCHDAGVCMISLNFAGNMSVDQPSGPTNGEFVFCGTGLSVTGNFIGGNTTQDGILFDEACDGCSVQGNWFGFLDEAVKFSGGGTSSAGLTLLGNSYSTVTTKVGGTRPTQSIMQENTGGTIVNEPGDIWLNADTDANSNAGAVVIGSNATSTSATHQFDFTEAYAQWRRGNDLRFYDADDSNYVEATVGAVNITSNKTLTIPDATGTIAVSASAPLVLNATTGNLTLTQNTGTDVTADLEEETHASEHSLGGTDPITVTNLASACSDAQVLGGDAGGTGVECQTDDDVPEAADYSNLTAGTGITNSPTGTINATLGTAITSSEITDGEIVNADINASAAIALSKLANMSTDRLLGRDTASSGAIEEISLTSPLAFTGAGAIQISDPSDCTNQFVTGAGANLSLTCTTATLAGAQFANQGTTTTVLHGNAAGNPSWSAIVSADVTDGTLTSSDLGTDSVSSDELNATGVEAEMEAVMDLQDMQGAVTDAQVPDTITASNYLPLAGGTLTGNLVLSADAGEGVSGGGLSDCDNATTSKLLWDSTTNKFSCGTDQTGAGGGDAITVNSSAATDPDFLNGDIDWTLTGGNSITATVACTGCVDSTDLADSISATTFTGALVGNADTATALAANPSDCASDTYATTIAASGNLTCATVTNAGLAGSIAMSKTLLTADAGVALSTNSLTTASDEQNFLKSGALTCGASTNGKMQVHTTPLQYCDNAATPALQYAAYGNSTGQATALNTGSGSDGARGLTLTDNTTNPSPPSSGQTILHSKSSLLYSLADDDTAPGGILPPTQRFVRTSSYTNATTSLTDIFGSSANLANAGGYIITGHFQYSTSASTTDFGLAFDLSAATSAVISVSAVCQDSTANNADFGVATADNTAVTIADAAGAVTDGSCIINGYIKNGTSSGTLTINAKAIGAGTLTISTGSNIVVQRVS